MYRQSPAIMHSTSEGKMQMKIVLTTKNGLSLSILHLLSFQNSLILEIFSGIFIEH